MFKIKKELIVENEQGLHARPASMFVQVANKYASKVFVEKGNQRVNGKSIMGILTLEVGKDSKVILEIEGEDAEEAYNELEKIVIGKLQ